MRFLGLATTLLAVLIPRSIASFKESPWEMPAIIVPKSESPAPVSSTTLVFSAGTEMIFSSSSSAITFPFRKLRPSGRGGVSLKEVIVKSDEGKEVIKLSIAGKEVSLRPNEKIVVPL